MIHSLDQPAIGRSLLINVYNGSRGWYPTVGNLMIAWWEIHSVVHPCLSENPAIYSKLWVIFSFTLRLLVVKYWSLMWLTINVINNWDKNQRQQLGAWGLVVQSTSLEFILSQFFYPQMGLQSRSFCCLEMRWWDVWEQDYVERVPKISKAEMQWIRLME